MTRVRIPKQSVQQPDENTNGAADPFGDLPGEKLDAESPKGNNPVVTGTPVLTAEMSGARVVETKGTPLAAPAPPANPSAGTVPAVQRIIESVFELDIESTWKRLHEALRATEGPRVGAAQVRSMLAIIDDRCREAHKLYVNVKLELERYRTECEKSLAAIRAEATAELQAEKDNKERSKAITEADIRARMLENHPDEVQAQETGLRRFSLMVEHAEHLVKVLSQKSRSLQIEAGFSRGGTIDD